MRLRQPGGKRMMDELMVQWEAVGNSLFVYIFHLRVHWSQFVVLLENVLMYGVVVV